MCLYLWNDTLWLIENEEWQWEFKILRLLLRKLMSENTTQVCANSRFPNTKPKSRQSHPLGLGPHNPPHVRATLVPV